jgi:high-affinity nickel-transport protein
MQSAAMRRSLARFGGVVGGLNLVAWAVLLGWVAAGYPKMVGLGVLAYTFGLRHAFDADHISAIDNTVRKLLRAGRRPPVAVGTYFSLGHSTVVALLVAGLALAVRAVQADIPDLQRVGGVLGALVSAGFLYLIAAVNLAVFLGVWRLARRAATDGLDEAEVDEQLQRRGLMGRLLGGRWDLVRSEWHMYPVGLLFGLGFDTASEIALLAVSATAAAQRVSLAAVMALPLLFAAGMCLLDTADGIFMAGAYAWALADPLRRVHYNLTVTAMSVLVALTVGSVELGQVLAARLGWSGGVWAVVDRLDLGAMGYGIVGLFALTWAVSYGLWALRVQRQRPAATGRT